MKVILLAFISVVIATGCVAPQPPMNAPVSLSDSYRNMTIPKGKALIYVSSHYTAYKYGGPMEISIDGSFIGKINKAQFLVVSVNPGEVSIDAYIPPLAGPIRGKLVMKAETGKKYYFLTSGAWVGGKGMFGAIAFVESNPINFLDYSLTTDCLGCCQPD